MNHLTAAIERNRGQLKAAFRSGNRELAEIFAGVIVGQRILKGEIQVKLPPVPANFQ